PDSDAGLAAAITCPICGEPKLDQTPNDTHETAAYVSRGERGGAADLGGWPTVPGFQIAALLGAGSMGVVFKAQQTQLKRVGDLRRIGAGSHASTSQLIRFRIEAESASRLQHPGIVQVYAIGESRTGAGAEPMPFFSLEFVEGGSLATYLKGNPQSPRFAAE